jgi:hypothetical protein
MNPILLKNIFDEAPQYSLKAQKAGMRLWVIGYGLWVVGWIFLIFLKLTRNDKKQKAPFLELFIQLCLSGWTKI